MPSASIADHVRAQGGLRGVSSCQGHMGKSEHHKIRAAVRFRFSTDREAEIHLFSGETRSIALSQRSIANVN